MQKITLNTKTRQCVNPNTFLGYEGENQATILIFEFQDGFVDGLGQLYIKRGEDSGYVTLDKVEETYEFPVKSSILTQVGDVDMQVVITKTDGTIIKYDVFTMTVKDAIDTDSEIPEEYPSWQEAIAEMLAQTQEAIEQAENVSNQLLEDKANGVFNGKDGVDGKDGINGKDGVSPTVATEQTSTGAKINITDVNGMHTAEVFNGKDGINGKDGANGSDGKSGENGITPHIGENGNWWIGDTDTGTPASGSGSGGTGGDSTPVGNIISFMGTIAPTGYLTCDGTVLNIADYPVLAAHFETQFGSKNYFGGDGSTTFAVPDLRNEFLRGYHGEAEKQLSGEIGIHQDATEHKTILTNGGRIISYAKDASSVSNSATNMDDRVNNQSGLTSHAVSASTGSAQAWTHYTSRPTNVAVLYCIKY